MWDQQQSYLFYGDNLQTALLETQMIRRLFSEILLKPSQIKKKAVSMQIGNTFRGVEIYAV